ncbi:unnamed protein product [Sphenostylis stenocarpa]|uniref:Uncharacterized protein n=1 Tax=Sphenostylis stenocarpa TaxID=92480 RepID=A0AA86SQ23_9FABA|nr:unnamed protein product [Sphenostylis stenocarpa]
MERPSKSQIWTTTSSTTIIAVERPLSITRISGTKEPLVTTTTQIYASSFEE